MNYQYHQTWRTLRLGVRKLFKNLAYDIKKRSILHASFHRRRRFWEQGNQEKNTRNRGTETDPLNTAVVELLRELPTAAVPDQACGKRYAGALAGPKYGLLIATTAKIRE